MAGGRAAWPARLRQTLAPAARPGALDTALLVLPLFLVYQAGIVSGGAGRNGADFVTVLLIELCARDLGRYLLLALFCCPSLAAVLIVSGRAPCTAA